jgi:hypothetical protein
MSLTLGNLSEPAMDVGDSRHLLKTFQKEKASRALARTVTRLIPLYRSCVQKQLIKGHNLAMRRSFHKRANRADKIRRWGNAGLPQRLLRSSAPSVEVTAAWLTLKSVGNKTVKPDELARALLRLAMEGERDPIRLSDGALEGLVPATTWREAS